MAIVKPFRGVRYDPARVVDLSSVVSQPYDRIGERLRDQYYGLSTYNIARIIKGKGQGEGAGCGDGYVCARDTYQTWLEDGVLVREPSPALYVLHQTFTLADGSTRTRRGMIAALELTEFDEGIVLPHERTHSGPKVDRLRLLEATAVNFGHVFMLYPGSGINELLEPVVEGPPVAEVRELFEHDVIQRFWVVTDPSIISDVVREMAPRRNLIIADGHHRYETALSYRKAMRRKHPGAPLDAGFNYRMVTLVSMEDPGLVILPTHRLIHSYGRMDVAEALERAGTYFDVVRVADRKELERSLVAAQVAHPRFGLYDGNHYSLLTLRDPSVLETVLPDRAPDWRMLDVTVLHELFIERILEIDKAAVERQDNIDYLRDPQLGYDAVDAGTAEFLLIVNPTRREQVQACTVAGERMPQKSTDFYPKVISGLVMMPVNAEERI